MAFVAPTSSVIVTLGGWVKTAPLIADVMGTVTVHMASVFVTSVKVNCLLSCLIAACLIA